LLEERWKGRPARRQNSDEAEWNKRRLINWYLSSTQVGYMVCAAEHKCNYNNFLSVNILPDSPAPSSPYYFHLPQKPQKSINQLDIIEWNRSQRISKSKDSANTSSRSFRNTSPAWCGRRLLWLGMRVGVHFLLVCALHPKFDRLKWRFEEVCDVGERLLLLLLLHRLRCLLDCLGVGHCV